jgi:drug/metabolite transporter (DMT)-like permease
MGVTTGGVAVGWRRTIDPGGYLLVIGSALCYSALPILGKVAYGAGMTVGGLLSTRFALGSAILWIAVLAVPALRRAAGRLPLRRAGALLAWGMVGLGGQSMLFFSALRFISASMTEVLLYTCPAFVALILWATGGVRPSAVRLAAIGLAMSGTALCVGLRGGGMDLRGVGLAILTGLWYAVFTLVLHRIIHGVPALLSGACINVGAAAWCAVAAAIGGGPRLPHGAAAWGAVLGMVATSTVFGIVLFVMGLKRTGPQVASILSTFEPIGTLAIAALLLGERLRPAQGIGAGLIVGAALLLAATSKEAGDDAAALPVRAEPAEAAAEALAGPARD